MGDWQEVGGKLTRTFELADFRVAMGFVNEVAKVAEEMNHHPDVRINYNKVTLELFTHSAGAVMDKDHTLAELINKINHYR